MRWIVGGLKLTVGDLCYKYCWPLDTSGGWVLACSSEWSQKARPWRTAVSFFVLKVGIIAWYAEQGVIDYNNVFWTWVVSQLGSLCTQLVCDHLYQKGRVRDLLMEPA